MLKRILSFLTCDLGVTLHLTLPIQEKLHLFVKKLKVKNNHKKYTKPLKEYLNLSVTTFNNRQLNKNCVSFNQTIRITI